MITPITHDLIREFKINATGDVCQGDVILFREKVYSPRPGFKFTTSSARAIGWRRLIAEVIGESYGKQKQQHTFKLRILASDGVQPIEAGTLTHRKGRNVYRDGTLRATWTDETARKPVLDEKHQRGNAARRERRRVLAR